MQMTTMTGAQDGWAVVECGANLPEPIRQRIEDAVAAEMRSAPGVTFTLVLTPANAGHAEIRVVGAAAWSAACVVPTALPDWQLRNRVEALLRVAASNTRH